MTDINKHLTKTERGTVLEEDEDDAVCLERIWGIGGRTMTGNVALKSGIDESFLVEMMGLAAWNRKHKIEHDHFTAMIRSKASKVAPNLPMRSASLIDWDRGVSLESPVQLTATTTDDLQRLIASTDLLKDGSSSRSHVDIEGVSMLLAGHGSKSARKPIARHHTVKSPCRPLSPSISLDNNI
jgi:hypothetical protein